MLDSKLVSGLFGCLYTAYSLFYSANSTMHPQLYTGSLPGGLVPFPVKQGGYSPHSCVGLAQASLCVMSPADNGRDVMFVQL